MESGPNELGSQWLVRMLQESLRLIHLHADGFRRDQLMYPEHYDVLTEEPPADVSRVRHTQSVRDR